MVVMMMVVLTMGPCWRRMIVVMAMAVVSDVNVVLVLRYFLQLTSSPSFLADLFG